MSNEPTTAEKLRGLPWDIGFSAANSVFVQFTFFGSVFVLFLSELGLSKTQMGTVLSLLPFSNLIALFIAPTVARIGFKRTFLASWGLRSAITAFLLLTPLILSQLGTRAVLIYVTLTVAGFAIWRSVGMTARLPWVQEFVPDNVRGKFSALSNIAAQSAAFVAVIGAGLIVESAVGLTGFMILFGLGVVFGFVAVWSAAHVPGGAPVEGLEAESSSHRNIATTAKDRNFTRFLVGVGLIILATGPLASFLPLFYEEEVGLSTGHVVWLQNGVLLGGLVSSYIWGWSADRYGSKPVMMTGIVLKILLPVLWLTMPRNAPASLYVALFIAFLQGVAGMGWLIGSTRLRYVAVVPPEHRASYQSVYYAWEGVVGGFGQLMGGRVLDASAGMSGDFLFFTLDPYSILFVIGGVFPLIAVGILRRVRADSSVSTGEFAAMFFRGNPFVAVESLVRYHRARGERAAVTMTERLGRASSPLTVDELLDALADPRFNVRYEAIHSIARRAPDERTLNALISVLGSDEPALSTEAAWALGRIGDERASAALREGLEAEYRSVRAHCARALGTLGDDGTESLLLERLENETDFGLQLAYAAALGNLRAKDATDMMLLYLRAFEDESARSELSLALARIIGDEHRYIQLLKHCQEDPGTSTSQAVTAMKRWVAELETTTEEMLGAFDTCAGILARDDLEDGVESLSRIIRMLPRSEFSQEAAQVLEDCADCMELFGPERFEYVVLSLHTMRVGLGQQRTATFARVFGS